jgi:hypothetical protein
MSDGNGRPHWADRIIAVFTVLIFLTYITSNVFLWKQLKVTKGQLDQMVGSSNQTDRLIKETHTLAEAAVNQVSRLKDSVTETHALALEARRSADISRDTFVVSNRPYVGVTEGTVTTIGEGQKRNLKITLDAKNFGHSPGSKFVFAWVIKVNGIVQPADTFGEPNPPDNEIFPSQGVRLEGLIGTIDYEAVRSGKKPLDVDVLISYAGIGGQYTYCENLHYEWKQNILLNAGRRCENSDPSPPGK